MATVLELKAHIKSEYPGATDMPDGGLVVKSMTPAGREQPVFVGFSDDRVWFLAPFAKNGEIQAATAFEGTSAFGVVMFADWYCYSSVAYIETIDASEVRWFIDKMAIEGQYRMGQLA